MTELNAQIRLRPTRIGFLVNPSDKKSLRQIMRLNACLWGGIYNPIIPVYNRTPKEWKTDFRKSKKEIFQGYINFFEPDVYVECEEGLLEKAGLEAFRNSPRFERDVVSLNEFLQNELGDTFEPQLGQSITDILEDIYASERRFQLRDDFPAIYPSNENLFSEACIGCYPKDENANHFKQSYLDVFHPQKVKFTPELWKKLYSDNFETPFSVTKKHLETFRSWNDDAVIYILDPHNNRDIIDFWNLRTLPSPVYPVPIEWLPELTESLENFIKDYHRPLRGNNNGVMHHVTIEKAGSISEDQFNAIIIPFFQNLPQGSFVCKLFRTELWNVNYQNTFITQPERARVTSKSSNQKIELKNKSLTGVFNSLTPHFSQRYSSSRRRWANVIQISSTYDSGDSDIALSLPFNTFDKSWPLTGISSFSCGREGWVFLQDYKSESDYISFISNEHAFSSWFKRLNIEIKLSEAGRIAKQMLNSLRGFWGLFLIDDKDTIQFINKHATSTRKRTNAENGDTIEEIFEGKSASVSQWHALTKRKQESGFHKMLQLPHYIDRNIIQVGIESECEHCGSKNWHGLDELSYNLRCQRCLKEYKFPQGNLKPNNQNWKYRVIGPFSLPDYAQGAYTTLLTIRFFAFKTTDDFPSSFSTALELTHNGGQKAEIDFALWVPQEKRFDTYGEPRLIIGEAKSFGEDIVKDDDLNKMKKTASLLPNSIIVISVLKDGFSEAEKARLRDFVEWSRGTPKDSRPKHWVILLTGIELFTEFLQHKWESLGEPWSNHAQYHSTREFESLSDSTLAIYLGSDPYHKWVQKKRNG
ncbi:hypothetical protein [Hydrogenovibrio marinus]|uniref:Uncharacterized protein n=1 Tax=Hydrogenovibrio marinus TaxID=28885 RepID=A0A066ZZ96_HYDMR|nr:hypothetical protein [Hydrogenovibrio marinus]KDN95661.1 hypothetical protein EI16_05005 [Hydrogenovibrio marinus]BBN58861.1 hypothetical protein HVMH_0455 [Hydrogenovibrio marinus]